MAKLFKFFLGYSQRECTIELLANYMVEVSVPTIIHFSVIHEDVGNLYEWLTFRPKILHQSQILHVGNNTVWPSQGQFIGHNHRPMLEGGFHLQEDQREQMDEDDETSWPSRMNLRTNGL